MLNDIKKIAKAVVIILIIVWVVGNYGHQIGQMLGQFMNGLNQISAGMNGG